MDMFGALLQPWLCNHCKYQQDELGFTVWVTLWAFATGLILFAKWYSYAPSSSPLPSEYAPEDWETDPTRDTITMATKHMCTYRVPQIPGNTQIRLHRTPQKNTILFMGVMMVGWSRDETDVDFVATSVYSPPPPKPYKRVSAGIPGSLWPEAFAG